MKFLYEAMSFLSIIGGLGVAFTSGDFVAIGTFWVSAGIFKLCSEVHNLNQRGTD